MDFEHAELGQTYQHRNLRIIGKLIGKDDKRKLYVIQKADGETLEISYAVFFRYWRVYSEELQEEFENAVDYIPESDNAEFSEVGVDAKNSRKTNTILNLLDYHKKEQSREALHRFLCQTVMEELLPNLDASEYFALQGIPDKSGIALKYCGRRIVEIYAKQQRKAYIVYMPGKLYENINWTIDLSNSSVMSCKSYKLDTVFYLKTNMLSQFCADLTHALNITLSQELKNYEN